MALEPQRRRVAAAPRRKANTPTATPRGNAPDGGATADLGHIPARHPSEPGPRALPALLRRRMESMSGAALDDVRVHHNSAEPARLGAHAFARGRDIHLAPGQERHLPHEAWHIIQQARGGVQATGRVGGVAVNDHSALEAEADRMGDFAARGAAAPRAQAARQAQAGGADVAQMVRFVRHKGVIRSVEHGKDEKYKLRKNSKNRSNHEYWADDADFLNEDNSIREGDEHAAARKAELMAANAERRTKDRRTRRITRRKFGRARRYKTKEHGGSEKIFRPLSQSGAGPTNPEDMVYRGMSVNNIRNLQRAKAAGAKADGVIFSVENPEGKATVEEHVRDDADDSPFLSFEKGGYEISAGKYAPKPVDPRTGRPEGVQVRKGGFLKQRQSYKTRQRQRTRSKLGYVGGVKRDKGTPMVDISDKWRAPDHLKDEESIQRAIADREVLLRPGAKGVPRSSLGVVAKVKQVPEEYFDKHVGNQTRDKTLGLYRPYGEKMAPEFYKVQIDRDETDPGIGFDVPPDLMREEDDSTDEMSDIEEMDLSSFEPRGRAPSSSRPSGRRRSPSPRPRGRDKGKSRSQTKWSRSPSRSGGFSTDERKERDWGSVRSQKAPETRKSGRPPPYRGRRSPSPSYSPGYGGGYGSSKPAYKGGYRGGSGSGYSSSSSYSSASPSSGPYRSRRSPPPSRKSPAKSTPISLSPRPRKSEKAAGAPVKGSSTAASVRLTTTAKPKSKPRKKKQQAIRPPKRDWRKKSRDGDGGD